MTTATMTLDEALNALEAALPDDWVFQLNIWRPEDWKSGTLPGRWTAAAGPNTGPEQRWLVGAADTHIEAVQALTEKLPR
jgi:hypothetical protein